MIFDWEDLATYQATPPDLPQPNVEAWAQQFQKYQNWFTSTYSHITGYHYTRLFDDELEDIKLNGLQVVNEQLLEQKIRRILREAEAYQHLDPKQLMEEIKQTSTWQHRMRHLPQEIHFYINKYDDGAMGHYTTGSELLQNALVELERPKLESMRGKPYLIKVKLSTDLIDWCIPGTSIEIAGHLFSQPNSIDDRTDGTISSNDDIPASQIIESIHLAKCP